MRVSVIFKQGIPVVFEYAISKTYNKKCLDTTLLIIYRQRLFSAL